MPVIETDTPLYTAICRERGWIDHRTTLPLGQVMPVAIHVDAKITDVVMSAVESPSVFDVYLAKALEDPEVRKGFEESTEEVATCPECRRPSGHKMDCSRRTGRRRDRKGRWSK